MRLLIVEDDPLIGPALKAVLENAGHVVIGPARDAVKAARIARRDLPDLALVDVYLSGGENGLSLVRRLWQEMGVPSVVVTGFDFVAEDGLDCAVGLLRKPVMPKDLISAVAAVQQVLGGNRPIRVPASLSLFELKPRSDLPIDALSKVAS